MRNHKYLLVIVACISMAITGISHIHAETIYDTVYINNGTFHTIDDTVVNGLVFNNIDTFQLAPAIIHISNDQELSLSVINNDSVDHTVIVKDHNGTSVQQITIAVNDTATFDALNNPQPVIYNLSSSDDRYSYAGLSSLVIFDDTTNIKPFYWNVRELDVDWLSEYNNLNIEDSLNYHPEYFTINNLSFPRTTNDPKGFVKAQLFDTIRIYLYNSGIMNHNFHFHGYHTRVIFSSVDSKQVGWEKDSFPLDKGEGLIMEFVPKQTGKYPAHNHNLGATLGNNMYPNGMVTQIYIIE